VHKNCDRGKLIVKTFFNIIESFFKRMQMPQNANLPYFFFNFLGEYTHVAINSPPNFDKYFVEKIIQFEKKGYFDNTLLVIYRYLSIS
jgi:hypothetical protein